MSLKRGTASLPEEHVQSIASTSHITAPHGMPSEEDEPFHKNEQDTHTHLQWLLAKLGQKVGCSVWIAVNDHQKVWKNERLGDLSLSSLPLFTDSAFQHIIRRIDVLWLHQETIVAAYEIEHTTDIAMGLLRLYDLGALCSHAEYLCIVAPHDRFRRIQFELSRPAFQGQEMHHRCRLISEELLLEEEEHMLRWAGSLSVIENLLHPFEESASR
jgi:type II restriction enzyme